MRPAAEIDKLAGAVDRNLFIGLGELLDEVALHEVAFFFELRQPLVARQKLARVRDILLHQFLHLLLDFFQILRSEGRGPIEIVEESALGSRAVAQLGLRKKFQHRRRQQVRGGMTVNFQCFGIFVGQKTQVGIFLKRTGKVDEVTVGFGHESRIRQPLADGLRNIERRRALGNILHAPVRKLHMNAVCHKFETCRCAECFSLLEGLGRVKPARPSGLSSARTEQTS